MVNNHKSTYLEYYFLRGDLHFPIILLFALFPFDLLFKNYFILTLEEFLIFKIDDIRQSAQNSQKETFAT